MVKRKSEIMESVDESSIENYNIAPSILKNMLTMGISSLTPPQIATMKHFHAQYKSEHCPWKAVLQSPMAEQPGDILVCSPTGSGKTLSYALPIVSTLLSDNHVPPNGLKAVIIVPTMGLVTQVKSVFDKLVHGTELRVFGLSSASASDSANAVVPSLITGESIFLSGEQSSILHAHILISTKGRIVHHIKNTTGFDALIKRIRFLVVDEADRCLGNNGEEEWVQLLCAERDSLYASPPDVQEDVCSQIIGISMNPRIDIPIMKMMFSATQTRNPAKLSALRLHNPVTLNVASPSTSSTDSRYTIPEKLSQKLIMLPSSSSLKPLALIYLILTECKSSTLVFTHSREATTSLANLLSAFMNILALKRQNLWKSVSVSAFSSDLSPSERKKTLNAFNKGAIDVLVTTDGLARGVDFLSTLRPEEPHDHSEYGPGTHHIINYDIPGNLKTYIHRIGRTARSNRSGKAFTLVTKTERKAFERFFENKQNLTVPEVDDRLGLTESNSSEVWTEGGFMMNIYLEALESLREAK